MATLAAIKPNLKDKDEESLIVCDNCGKKYKEKGIARHLNACKRKEK